MGSTGTRQDNKWQNMTWLGRWLIQTVQLCSTQGFQTGKIPIQRQRGVAIQRLTHKTYRMWQGLRQSRIVKVKPATSQFAYCPNRTTDDAISIALRTALSHLDKRNTYVRMLFIDYSSAFSTIVPSQLIIKLVALGLNHALCNWVMDFLTGRPQVVNTGAPRGWMLSPLLCSLFKVVLRYCSPEVEYLMIRWPHYLPRELSSILFVAVYLPPQTDAVIKTALNKL
jgi:hypothetical protein